MATPITTPATVPLLMPPELFRAFWPTLGSAVADGVSTIVLTWPVTVMTLVTGSVFTEAVEVGSGDGDGVEYGVEELGGGV